MARKAIATASKCSNQFGRKNVLMKMNVTRYQYRMVGSRRSQFIVGKLTYDYIGGHLFPDLKLQNSPWMRFDV